MNTVANPLWEALCDRGEQKNPQAKMSSGIKQILAAGLMAPLLTATGVVGLKQAMWRGWGPEELKRAGEMGSKYVEGTRKHKQQEIR